MPQQVIYPGNKPDFNSGAPIVALAILFIHILISSVVCICCFFDLIQMLLILP